MKTITCGIDLHCEKSNIFFTENKTGKEFYTIVPTQRNEILNLLDNFNGCHMQYAFKTGTMARFLYGVLNSHDYTKKIHVVHPKKFKVIVESKYKNDKIDSKKLAEGLLKGYLPLSVYMKSERCRKLQMLLNLRRSRVKDKTISVRQAKNIVRGLGIRTSGSTTNMKGFTRLISNVETETYDRKILDRLMESFSTDVNAIEEIEREIKEMVEREFSHEYELLLSIPGIGFITAASLLAKIDTIDRFKKQCPVFG